MELEGFAEKKADNLLAAIDASRQQSLARLITALGIRGVGEVMAADLARFYPDLEALSRASLEELQTIEGVGPNTAQAIVDWFERPANRQVVDKLRLRRRVAARRSRRPARRRTAAGRADLRRHRHPARHVARRSQGIHPGPRRQGDRLGQQEDQLPGGGRSGGVEAGKSAGAGRAGFG